MRKKIVVRRGCNCEEYPFCEHAPNAVKRTYPTRQIEDAVSNAKNFVRYYEDTEFAAEQERIARDATDGNVSGIEAIVDSLMIELQRLQQNPGSMVAVEGR